jgi:hypothetical protein
LRVTIPPRLAARLRLPAVRQQLFDAAVLLRWQPLHDVLQVGMRFVPIELGRVQTAVDKVRKGKGRIVNARFEVMCAHYLFDPDFCNVASGWEKGVVEKNVQDSRRQIWIALCAVARAEHPVLSKRRMRLEHLSDYQWIMPRRGVVARDWLDGLFISRQLPLPVSKIGMDTQTADLLRLAADTDLLSIAPGISQADLGAAGLAIVPLPETQWRRAVGAVMRSGGSTRPLVSHFVEVLAQAFGS